jgi:hypothetical protein
VSKWNFCHWWIVTGRRSGFSHRNARIMRSFEVIAYAFL